MTGSWISLSAGERWDALALMQALRGRRTFLVQDGPAHWELYVECQGREGAFLDEIGPRIREWLAARSLEEASCRLPDGRRATVTRAPEHAVLSSS